MGTHAKGKSEGRCIEAYVQLVHATGVVRARLDKLLSEHELTENQMGVLATLMQQGPQCQRALAEKIAATGASVTLLVDQLEARGLVRRERNENDRRFVTVNLTADGKRFIEKIFPGHSQAISESLGGLTASEQAELARLCAKLGQHAEGLSHAGDEEDAS
ncbi:MAG: MarR family transcriptional regulator [Deltaproteobacteria bacterium]|nr:MarR family transcriptional regulator [Deltaproteobacteria bacterium]